MPESNRSLKMRRLVSSCLCNAHAMNCKSYAHTVQPHQTDTTLDRQPSRTEGHPTAAAMKAFSLRHSTAQISVVPSFDASLGWRAIPASHTLASTAIASHRQRATEPVPAKPKSHQAKDAWPFLPFPCILSP